MRRIKMSIPWIKITIYHLPIVVLFLYIVYGSLGGITYKIIHTSICATDALFMAGWLLAGERKEIKKSYRYLAIICLVAVSMGQCAFTIGL